jgi:predicted acyl esterase
MHYGHKRMSFKKDVAIQMRDGTVLYVNVFRPSEDGRYPVVVTPSLLHGDHDLPKMSAGRMVCVSLLGLRKRKYAIDRWSQPGKADGAIHRVEHLARTDVNAVKVQFLAVDDAGIDSSSSGERADDVD